MSAPSERNVRLPGNASARVWSKGSGAPLVFLGGLMGLPRWPAFLDRLAERRHVVVPSLPGFFGAEDFRELDQLEDWVIATLDLLDACEPEPFDLVGASLGASLAAEVAAFSRSMVRRLALVAPFGVFDTNEPVADFWAIRKGTRSHLVSSEPEALDAFLACPEDADELEWEIQTARCLEAGARLLWPTTDTGLARRLHRIQAPTLLLWGSEDRVVPAGYAKRFADGIAGYAEVRSIEGAGHTAELDRPDEVAEAILAFID